MEPRKVTRPFGEPLDEEQWELFLEAFTDIGEDDVPDAIAWWDRNASNDWVGALGEDEDEE